MGERNMAGDAIQHFAKQAVIRVRDSLRAAIMRKNNPMKTTRSRAFHDLVLLASISAFTLCASLWIDPFARAVAWIYHHDNWPLDELFTLIFVLVVGLAVYSWRRWRELEAETRDRERAQEYSRELAVALESTRSEVLALRGILRICEVCQRIQDGTKSWITLELYMQAQSNTKFAHGLCPDCARKVYGGAVTSTPLRWTPGLHSKHF
jgi:hypothetical protein